MQFKVENMTCGGCARSVVAAIRAVDPDASVTANPDSGQVDVTSHASAPALAAALSAAGFPVLAQS